MAREHELERFLGWRQVRDLTGLGRTTAWRMRQAGDFPEPVPISPGRVAWRASDIARWNASRGRKDPRSPAAAGSTEASPPRPRDNGRVTPVAAVTTAPPTTCEPAHPKPRHRRRCGPAVAQDQLGFDF